MRVRSSRLWRRSFWARSSLIGVMVAELVSGDVTLLVAGGVTVRGGRLHLVNRRVERHLQSTDGTAIDAISARQAGAMLNFRPARRACPRHTQEYSAPQNGWQGLDP